MKASQSDQNQILDIQKMDIQVSTLRNKEKTLPEIAELAALTSRLTTVRDLQVAAQTQASDIQRELTRAEGDVEQINNRLAKDEARLASGSTSAKELEQLQHELGSLGARKAELEEIELEVMMQLDGAKSRLAELQEEERSLNAKIDDLNIRKENAITEISAQITTLTNERTITIGTTDKALVDLYEKVRSQGGLGAAALTGGQCGGCNLTINSVEIARIKSLDADEIVRCEECRCILVRGA
jgi:predicted  nucleic acid-binding Zn-ribbon protein